MVDDERSQGPRAFEGLPHDVLVSHGPAVVGERDGAGPDEGGPVGRGLTLESERNGGDGQDVDDGAPPRLVQDEFRDGGRVVRGIRIGHPADRREPSAGGRPGGRPDGLFFFEARLAEMDVHVDEARSHDQPGGIDHIVAAGRDAGGYGLDRLSGDENVQDRVGPRIRIDDPAVPDQESHGPGPLIPASRAL